MRRLALLLAVLGVAAFAVATGDATALTALPVLGLFALLLDGRYVGADRLVARASRPRRRRIAWVAPLSSRVVVRPYASAVLGRRLGRRGPPALLVV